MLLELFLHDGVGTMISYENLESLREATPDDVGGILSLIEPLESDGTLVRRGRHQIERDIDHFSVIEHDGVLFGCAALYPYQQEKIGEMACLTVAPEAQGRATANACSSASSSVPAPAASRTSSCSRRARSTGSSSAASSRSASTTCRKTAANSITGSASRSC